MTAPSLETIRHSNWFWNVDIIGPKGMLTLEIQFVYLYNLCQHNQIYLYKTPNIWFAEFPLNSAFELQTWRPSRRRRGVDTKPATPPQALITGQWRAEQVTSTSLEHVRWSSRITGGRGPLSEAAGWAHGQRWSFFGALLPAVPYMLPPCSGCPAFSQNSQQVVAPSAA